MAIQYTPSLGLPYPEVTDAPLIASRDLRALAQKMDSEGAQIRGESVSALTAAQAAEALAAQALARALAIEEPVHVGPNAPTDGEALWVDTDEDAPPAPVSVSSEDITDATDVGRAVLTAPLSVDARNALAIYTGTRALLDAGTDTAERTWDAKELHEYVTDTAAAAGAAAWDDLTGKPDTFPPSAHNHDDRYYTEAGVDAKIAAAMAAPGTMPNPSDLGTAHLDTITTPGHYAQRFQARATLANGYPYEGRAGVLEVLAWHPTGIIQRWTSQAGGVATRYLLSGNWQQWQNAMAQTIT